MAAPRLVVDLTKRRHDKADGDCAIAIRTGDHREHELEGATETADRVGKDLGMLGYGGGNPWMGELQ